MAMDVLTTVASESTFSDGGRVIDKKSASIKTDTIEVLLCGGDWIEETHGIRSLKEGNEDHIALEFASLHLLKLSNH
ncbi:hypothetical protein OROHE_018457 [Orobanche hederae]